MRLTFSSHARSLSVKGETSKPQVRFGESADTADSSTAEARAPLPRLAGSKSGRFRLPMSCRGEDDGDIRSQRRWRPSGAGHSSRDPLDGGRAGRRPILADGPVSGNTELNDWRIMASSG